MSFVSYKPGIDMSASFREAQSQSNIIEDGILYVENVQRMEFVSAWEQDPQVNPDDSLGRKEGKYLLFQVPEQSHRLYPWQTNCESNLAETEILFRATSVYPIYWQNNVERVESTTISIPKKDHF